MKQLWNPFGKVVGTTTTKFGAMAEAFKDLMLKTYPSLTNESTILIPLYGSDFDSVIFVVLDETVSLEELEDSDIEELIKNKQVAGIGSLYGPAIWTLDPNAQCICDPGFETSLWGCDAEEEKLAIDGLDPYGIFQKKERKE